MNKIDQQNRSKESFTGVPKISKEIMDSILDQYLRFPDADKKLELATAMRSEEPLLFDFVKKYTDDLCEDPVQGRLGAFIVYQIFKSLENLGISVPKVSTETIGTYEEEDRTFANAVADLPKEMSEFKGEIDAVAYIKELRERLKFSDTMLPDPINYAEENPVLMVWVASQKTSLSEGAMVVYELKRRQILADQLSRQLAP